MKKRLTTMFLAAILAITAMLSGAAAEETPAAEGPYFLIPAQYAEHFNSTLKSQVDSFGEALGTKNAKTTKENLVLVNPDPIDGTFYYGNQDWSVETAFLFPDAASVSESSPAAALCLTIRRGIPDVAVYFVQMAFGRVIASAFPGEVSEGELDTWLQKNTDAAVTFTLPGYTLYAYISDEMMQYALLPPQDEEPQQEEAQAPAAEETAPQEEAQAPAGEETAPQEEAQP